MNTPALLLADEPAGTVDTATGAAIAELLVDGRVTSATGTAQSRLGGETRRRLVRRVPALAAWR